MLVIDSLEANTEISLTRVVISVISSKATRATSRIAIDEAMFELTEEKLLISRESVNAVELRRVLLRGSDRFEPVASFRELDSIDFSAVLIALDALFWKLERLFDISILAP